MYINKKPYIYTLFLVFFMAFANAQTTEIGWASLYSDYQEGSLTASGQKYNKMALTAGHRSITFGTYIIVTNRANGKTVRVKITDRGPVAKENIILLSHAAARALGITKDGESMVSVALAPFQQASSTASTPPPVKQRVEEPIAVKPLPVMKKKSPPSPKIAAKPKPKQVAKKYKAPTNAPILWTTAPTDGYELYQVSGTKLSREGYAVQIASSSQYDGIMRKIADLQARDINELMLCVENGPAGLGKVYKLLLGAFDSYDEADAYRKVCLRKGINGAFVLNLADKYVPNNTEYVPLR